MGIPNPLGFSHEIFVFLRVPSCISLGVALVAEKQSGSMTVFSQGGHEKQRVDNSFIQIYDSEKKMLQPPSN